MKLRIPHMGKAVATDGHGPVRLPLTVHRIRDVRTGFGHFARRWLSTSSTVGPPLGRRNVDALAAFHR